MVNIPPATIDPIAAKIYGRIFSPKQEKIQQDQKKQKDDKFFNILKDYNMGDKYRTL